MATNGPRCSCDAGFVLDGAICRDENECAIGSHDCDPFARCVNLPGAFTCACPAGFSGDGRTCTEINECASGAALCDKSATCVNTIGSYRCECKTGFVAEGLTCKDIDECSGAPCRPNETCTNTLGGHTCECAAPFFLDSNVCRRYRAFVLDDGGSAARLLPILQRELDVTPSDPINYDLWDTTLPSPPPDVIVWLTAINYYNPTTPEMRDAIRTFVMQGGGLVRTEWAAWQIAADPTFAEFFAEDLMPVGQYDPISLAYVDTNNPVPWHVLKRDHEIARGVPEVFSAKGSVAQLGLKPTARAVFEISVAFGEGPQRVPGVSYMPLGAGMVVHVNHDLLYREAYDPGPQSIRLSEPPLQRLILNAVEFAAKRRGVVP